MSQSQFNPQARLEPLRALLHPVWIGALAVLVLNDHVLKQSAHAGWVTGKLSDFAGMIVAPVLLAAVLRVRSRRGVWACAAAVAGVFSAINLSSVAAGYWDALMTAMFLPFHTMVDLTDLMAVPMAGVGVWVLGRRMERPVGWSFGGQAAGVRLVQVVLVGVALVACMATSRAMSPEERRRLEEQRRLEEDRSDGARAAAAVREADAGEQQPDRAILSPFRTEVLRWMAADEPAGRPETRQDLRELYEQLFGEIRAHEIDRLVIHEDEQVAIAAAWERVRRTVPTDEWDAPVRSDALNRFVGFLEGRLGELPPWWSASVLSAGAYRRSNIWFSFGRRSDPVDPLRFVGGREREENLWTAWDVQLEITDDGRWILRRGGRPCMVPAELREAADFIEAIHVAFGDDYAIVMLHNMLPVGLYHIGRVHSETGDLVWSVAGWASGRQGGGTGVHWHWAELRLEADRVLVFGHTGGDIYIECFSVETGEALWRFGTGHFD